MNAAECKAESRVQRQDLPRLSQALQVPPVFRCEQRSICDSMEGLCILLKRVAYHCRLSDLIPRFARPVSVLSLITNHVRRTGLHLRCSRTPDHPVESRYLKSCSVTNTRRKNGFTPNLHSANMMQTYVSSRANL